MVDYNRIHFVWDSALSPKNGANIVRRGDHRSPENCIHFIRDGTTTSFLPPLRHFVQPLLKERLLRRPLRGAVVKRLRGGEQQFNIKKAVIH